VCGQLPLPLISLLIEEFEDHGRERERKRSEAGILFKQRRKAVPVFVKAKFITSISQSIKVTLIGFRRICAFCQGQSPHRSMTAHGPLHRHQWSESEANVRPKFGTVGMTIIRV